ncbi:MAG TPA: hypothetical protein VH558_10550 [Pseudolabrys sp.]|jgi:hypothetical protein
MISWGQILYRAAAITAACIVGLALLTFLSNFSERGIAIVPVVALGVAALIWLGGRCCRYLFNSPGS